MSPQELTTAGFLFLDALCVRIINRGVPFTQRSSASDLVAGFEVLEVEKFATFFLYQVQSIYRLHYKVKENQFLFQSVN